MIYNFTYIHLPLVKKNNDKQDSIKTMVSALEMQCEESENPHSEALNEEPAYVMNLVLLNGDLKRMSHF